MAEYIEREALLCEIERREALMVGDKIVSVDAMKSFIKNRPAADVAPVRHGRIVVSLEDGRYRRRFSCCGDDATMITQWAWPKYCPNCGAKMDG